MGKGYELQCSCGEEIILMTGVGFMLLTQGDELYQEVKNGSWGKNWTNYIDKYPDGMFDTTREVYQCPVCKNIANEYVGTYYVTDCDDELGNHAYMKHADEDYPDKRIRLHICNRCKRKMKRVNLEKDSLFCPKCGSELLGPFVNTFMWD